MFDQALLLTEKTFSLHSFHYVNPQISETWSYPPLNDTAEAAARVNEAVAQRGWRILRDAASI